MIQSFGCDGTENIYHGVNSKAARKVLPQELHATAFRKLDMVNAAAVLTDLKVPPGNRLEALKDDLDGWHSIRINEQYRIIFKWSNGAHDVYIDDYH